MMRKSIVYSLTLSGIDILVFFLVYFTFSLLSNNFNFASAMMDGGLAILARFLYLQIFVQFFFDFFHSQAVF